MGWDVRAFDPDPEAARKLEAVLANARASLPGLYDVALPPEGRLTLHGSLAEAVEGVEWVQESVPERLDLKHRTLRRDPGGEPRRRWSGRPPRGSSRPSCRRGRSAPGRILVAHPFNPVYLLPVVEVVPSPANPPEAVARGGGDPDAPSAWRRIVIAQGDRRPRRRPAPRGGLARGAVAREGRRGDHGGHRRDHPARLRPALGADGPVRDLPRRRGRGGDEALHGPVRAGAEVALDQAHGRAGVRRRAGGPDRRAVGRAVGARCRSASWSGCGTATSWRSCGG